MNLDKIETLEILVKIVNADVDNIAQDIEKLNENSIK